MRKLSLFCMSLGAWAHPTFEPKTRAVDAPTVNLGYASYTGYSDANAGLNYYKGIRYAAPPTGQYRWAKPQPPPQVDTSIPVVLDAWPPMCPQTPQAPSNSCPVQTEDCLYLSVVAPPNAENLPVLVWIHGGGYGGGAGNADFAEMILNNDRGFIYVAIQYRLGAFGFLSSGEMGQFGAPNAGLWDQEYALQWVQKHIGKFGGDASRVTISGSSAGGGSVMTHVLAHGGRNGTSSFQNAIAGSQYLPQQWPYDGEAPVSFYTAFAAAVGCLPSGTTNPNDGSVLKCLRGADSTTLQQANCDVNSKALGGQWAFLPVTDGVFLPSRPSDQLSNGQVNGARILTSNNANEGTSFIVGSIVTDEDWNNYMKTYLPLFSTIDLENLAKTYAIDPIIPNGPLFATQGDQGPTAMNQSTYAIGNQQRAYNLCAETTFVCPSYWLASAFARQTGAAWHYQFSVPPSYHGHDLNAVVQDGYVGAAGSMSPAFRLAVQKIWGRFIMFNDPTLPDDVLAEITTDSTGVQTGDNIDAANAKQWAKWQTSNFSMLNLNMTAPSQDEQALFRIVDGYSWEGGRGARCDAWAEVGSITPA
ncbi:hypothetical protein G7046_g7937 [Stylonectria norvegica]|nr:hypothetical protein G7046_g7937 [Stylonectria norvegica]